MSEIRTIKIDDPVYRDDVNYLLGLIAAKTAIEEAGVALAGATLAKLAVDKVIAEHRIRLYQTADRNLFKAGVPLDRVARMQFIGADRIELQIDEEDLFDRAKPAAAKGEPDPPAPER